MLYVLGYPRFDATLTASLDRFRAQHEPARAQLVPPHITLVFGLSGMVPEDFVALCKDRLKGVDAIPLDFDSFAVSHDPFEDTHKLLLLCRQGRAEITSLHQELYRGPQKRQFDPAQPYRPHMTVATHHDPRVLTQIDPAAIGAFPIAAVLDTVEVVALAAGKLTTLERFNLTPSPTG